MCFLIYVYGSVKGTKDIGVGDEVLAYDEDSGLTAYKKVVRLFRNKTDTWCTVTVKREGQEECNEITSTPGHKYYLPDNTIIREQNERQEHASYMGLSNKWVSAIHLKYGDRVLLSDDTYGIIESVTTLHLSTPETTYNFEVEDYHTYFVGNGVCVHNMNCNEIYSSLEEHPVYKQAKAEGFKSDHLISDKVRNPGIEFDLQTHKLGKWQKIYNNGYIRNTEVSIHYFKHARSGSVYRVEVFMDYWSPPI